MRYLRIGIGCLFLTVILALAGCGGKSADEKKAKANQQQSNQPSVIDQELKKQYQMYKEMRQYQLEQQIKAEEEVKKKEEQSKKQEKESKKQEIKSDKSSGGKEEGEKSK
ncbi:hypothetical protein FE783_00740 [Paenibacillus mesophilus]|uniref:hypothetical protein n=1 Tax=Paenibacillus mesophilus TaxID=2582849 RepID=UPI00110DFEC5|nr:hypothetical protein [Paenibacillus mesophilus]TMV52756.1 hypothetical protein FE783_00740 [Paenibacillus mesophilus]